MRTSAKFVVRELYVAGPSKRVCVNREDAKPATGEVEDEHIWLSSSTRDWWPAPAAPADWHSKLPVPRGPGFLARLGSLGALTYGPRNARISHTWMSGNLPYRACDPSPSPPPICRPVAGDFPPHPTWLKVSRWRLMFTANVTARALHRAEMIPRSSSPSSLSYELVEIGGLEPPTSALRTPRSPS